MRQRRTNKETKTRYESIKEGKQTKPNGKKNPKNTTTDKSENTIVKKNNKWYSWKKEDLKCNGGRVKQYK